MNADDAIARMQRQIEARVQEIARQSEARVQEIARQSEADRKSAEADLKRLEVRVGELTRQLEEKSGQVSDLTHQLAVASVTIPECGTMPIEFDVKKHAGRVALSSITAVDKYLFASWQRTGIPQVSEAMKGLMRPTVEELSGWLNARRLVKSDDIHDENFLMMCDTAGMLPILQKMRTEEMAFVSCAELADYVRYVAKLMSGSEDEVLESVASLPVLHLCAFFCSELEKLAQQLETDDPETATWLDSCRFHLLCGGGGTTSIKASDSMLKQNADRPEGGTDLYCSCTCLSRSDNTDNVKVTRTKNGTVADIGSLFEFQMKLDEETTTQQALAAACFCTSDNGSAAPITTYALLSSQSTYKLLFVQRIGFRNKCFVYHSRTQDGKHSDRRVELHEAMVTIINLSRLEGVWRAWLKSKPGLNWWPRLQSVAYKVPDVSQRLTRARPVSAGPMANANECGNRENCPSGCGDEPLEQPLTGEQSRHHERSSANEHTSSTTARHHPVDQWLQGTHVPVFTGRELEAGLHGESTAWENSEQWDEDDESVICAHEEDEKWLDYIANRQKAMQETAMTIPDSDCEFIARVLESSAAARLASAQSLHQPM